MMLDGEGDLILTLSCLSVCSRVFGQKSPQGARAPLYGSGLDHSRMTEGGVVLGICINCKIVIWLVL